MKSRRTHIVSTLAAATVLLGACASTPTEDTTPLVPVAEVNYSYSNGGVKGFFASEGTRRERVMGQMRRLDVQGKASGGLGRAIMGKRDQSEIVRLDKNLMWNLMHKQKRYSECAATGCEGLMAFEGDFEGEVGEAPSDCKISTTANTLDLKATGQQRDISGYRSSQHTLEWNMSARDNTGSESTMRLTVDFWLTPQTAETQQITAMRSDFQNAYLALMKQELYGIDASKMGGVEGWLMVMRLLTAGMEDAEIQKLMAPWRNLRIPDGFVMATKFQLDTKGENCAEPQDSEAEEDAMLDTSSIGGLLRSVGKQVVNQEIDRRKEEEARKIEMKPWFNYSETVTSFQPTEVRESNFTVPGNYKLINRR